MKDIKFNIPVTALAIVMTASSGINFYLNGDSVSFALFLLLALGLTAVSIEPADKENTTIKKRFKKIGTIFFAGALILLAYRLLVEYYPQFM